MFNVCYSCKWEKLNMPLGFLFLSPSWFGASLSNPYREDLSLAARPAVIHCLDWSPVCGGKV